MLTHVNMMSHFGYWITLHRYRWVNNSTWLLIPVHYVAIYLYPEPVNITLLDVASGAIADSVQYIPVQPVFVHFLLGLFVR